jgi:hypothetical protein
MNWQFRPAFLARKEQHWHVHMLLMESSAVYSVMSADDVSAARLCLKCKPLSAITFRSFVIKGSACATDGLVSINTNSSLSMRNKASDFRIYFCISWAVRLIETKRAELYKVYWQWVPGGHWLCPRAGQPVVRLTLDRCFWLSIGVN